MGDETLTHARRDQNKTHHYYYIGQGVGGRVLCVAGRAGARRRPQALPRADWRRGDDVPAARAAHSALRRLRGGRRGDAGGCSSGTAKGPRCHLFCFDQPISIVAFRVEGFDCLRARAQRRRRLIFFLAPAAARRRCAPIPRAHTQAHVILILYSAYTWSFFFFRARSLGFFVCDKKRAAFFVVLCEARAGALAQNTHTLTHMNLIC